MGFSFKLLVSQLTASEIPASAARGASHIYLNLVSDLFRKTPSYFNVLTRNNRFAWVEPMG